MSHVARRSWSPGGGATDTPVSPERPRGSLSLVLVVALASFLLAPTDAAHADAYDDFHAFAQTAFGALQDSLVHEWFGWSLEPPRDWWEHVSESSAAVGFTTNLPSVSYVEYGTGTAFDRVTPSTDRHYYQHLHHLTGLTPGSTVHYRAVMEAEDGTVIRSRERVLRPTPIPGAIRIPDDLPGPPYVLDEPRGHYLVTSDVVASGKAFEIEADSVVLDLGGHHVTYNDVFQESVGTTFFAYRDSAAFGVRSIGPDGLRIYNGTIAQGAGDNAAFPEGSVGFGPLYFWEASDLEVAGTVLEYSGSQVVGLYSHWQKQDNEFHHNVFVDRGTEVPNRHGLGSASIGVIGGLSRVHTHHNLVKRTRHNALTGELIHDNEIYIDSYATNSYGIPALSNGREAYGNKIFGTGYHVVAFGWGSENWWHDNFVHLAGRGPDFRNDEYGNQESLNGFRLTQYGGGTTDMVDSVVERNLVLVTGGACATDGACTQVRGLQYSSDPYVVDNVIRDNTIKVVMDESVGQAAAVVTQGLFSRCGTEAPVHYVDNVLISNIANVKMGDYAGIGCNHRFVGNELVRVGAREDYRTFVFGASTSTVGQYFYDSVFAGGSSYDLISFSQADQELTVGWTLTVVVSGEALPIEGAAVTVRDNAGDVLTSGATDAVGRFSDQVMAFRHLGAAGKILHTPLELTVEHEGRIETRTVPLDAPTEVSVVFPGPTAVTPPALGGELRLMASPSVMGRDTRFQWGRALGGSAVLRIYDLRGRGVREIRVPGGADFVAWDGLDRQGRRVGSGVYLARLSSDRGQAACRVVVVR